MRRRDEWRGLLTQLRDSGKGLKEFATAQGLNWRTLQHWKYILGKEASGRGRAARGRSPSAGAAARPQQNLSFVEVRAAAGVGDERFEIELSDGRRLHVPPSFDIAALQRLLDTLEARA